MAIALFNEQPTHASSDVACRYGYFRDGNSFKRYCCITGAETVPTGGGNYFESPGLEIGNAPDLTFGLQNPVVQPELRYQGFTWHSPNVPENALGKDWIESRSAMVIRFFGILMEFWKSKF